jgi:hypothetical protein
LHTGTQSTIRQALILVALASVGTSLGCVDLTRPWEKPGYRADARGNVDDVGGRGSPGDADDGYPTGPGIDDANFLPPEGPEDAEQPTPQRVDGGPVDTSRDTSLGKPDANTDAVPQPVDSSSDLPVDDSRTEGDDAFLKDDRKLDLNISVPDSHLVDTDVNVPVADGSLADTPLDMSSPPLDLGREVPVIAGLLASYPCESASGTELPDTSGHSKNAVLANGSGGSTPVGFSFGKGMVGNALTLSSRDQAYVSMPKGILFQLREVTIATWVNLNSGAAFQRIFDFGVDTNTFMYLVNASNSGFVRFRIVSAPLNKNQILEGAEAVPVGRWTHVALTLGDNGVSIYLDGAQVAQQAPAVLRPADLGDTGNNWIGRSPFAGDPYLDGQIDEFRIYDRVLSSAEIGDLASGL